MESHDTIPNDLTRIRPMTAMVVVGVLVLLCAAGFSVRFILDRRHNQELQAQAKAVENQPPIVDVVYPKPNAATVNVKLPGNTSAYQQTDLYARINGYLVGWDRKHDIGAAVTKGEELARIAAPEVDAQLQQAKASLDQANANVLKAESDYKLADDTAKRYEGLVATGGVTEQQLQEKQSAASQAFAVQTAAQAAVKVANATIQQLSAQTGFEEIVAPFDGIITARTYDIGALISPSNTGAGQKLFQIAQTDILRIFVSVPQTYSTMIKPLQKADFFVSNFPDKSFEGHVAASTGSLDPATHTLMTEVDIDNKDHALFPGMYGEVRFIIPRPDQVLTVPTSAMMFEATGTLLATVDADSVVHFQKVLVGRDMGTEIEIRDGLKSDQWVISNPGEKLTDKIKVQIAKKPEAPPSATATATAKTTSDDAATTKPADKGPRVADDESPEQPIPTNGK